MRAWHFPTRSLQQSRRVTLTSPSLRMASRTAIMVLRAAPRRTFSVSALLRSGIPAHIGRSASSHRSHRAEPHGGEGTKYNERERAMEKDFIAKREAELAKKKAEDAKKAASKKDVRGHAAF